MSNWSLIAISDELPWAENFLFGKFHRNNFASHTFEVELTADVPFFTFPHFVRVALQRACLLVGAICSIYTLLIIYSFDEYVRSQRKMTAIGGGNLTCA